jgi:uncharacterized protein with PQ loop repeat
VEGFEIAVLLGWLATAAFLVRLVPQPVRLIRTGVPHGVSPMAVMNLALTELAWLTYGLAENLVPVWVVSLPALPLGLWTVYLVRRHITPSDLRGSAIWFAAIVLGALTGTLVAVLVLSVLVNYGPQVVTAVRASDLQGLAPATWYLALLDAALWGAYGLAVGDPALLGYCVVLAGSAFVILARIARTTPSVARADLALASVGERA